MHRSSKMKMRMEKRRYKNGCLETLFVASRSVVVSHYKRKHETLGSVPAPSSLITMMILSLTCDLCRRHKIK